VTTPTETRPDEEQPDAGGVPAQEAVPRGLRARWARVQAAGEAGMSTAEYAVGTVAACAFAAVLYRVVTGGSVVDGLSALVADALATLS
jgi:glutathione S-transferase